MPRRTWGQIHLELRAARVGVVCHCNNLPPQVRICVEKLMARLPPRIIVATTTLGQGVNIGTSYCHRLYAVPLAQKCRISQRDFWNICGRAGRAFVDGEGKILFAMDMTGKAWQIKNAEDAAKKYFNLAHLDQVESGLLQLVRLLYLLASRVGISFETLVELAANDSFDRCAAEKATVEALLDWIDDQLLALHVEYKGDDSTVDWIDDAFRDSLAAIQEKAKQEQSREEQLIAFLKARTSGVLRKVPSPEARRSVIASGLPLSVGIVAFNDLDVFREMVDRYLNADVGADSLGGLVLEFETWARQHAKAIVESIPKQQRLDEIRPQWLAGGSLRKIIEMSGEDAADICTELYGYQLPWLLHSIAQKLDKAVEENRIEALAKVGLLVELGLPTEAAAKVFLAGVRSRTAAVDLSRFVRDSSVSVSKIRRALLDPETVAALSAHILPSTLEWLNLLSADHGVADIFPPDCSTFRLETNDAVDTLHARQLTPGESIYLCSTDGRFKCAVGATEEMPFDKLANDPRVAFSRSGDSWMQVIRDPRVARTTGLSDDFI